MPTTRDANGRYFIDRDGTIFGIILDFLRYSKLLLPPGFDQFEKLAADADFYQISSLKTAMTEYTSTSEMIENNSPEPIIDQYSFHVVESREKDELRYDIYTHRIISEQLTGKWCSVSEPFNEEYRYFSTHCFSKHPQIYKCVIIDFLDKNGAKLISTHVFKPNNIDRPIIYPETRITRTSEHWMIPYPLKWVI